MNTDRSNTNDVDEWGAIDIIRRTCCHYLQDPHVSHAARDDCVVLTPTTTQVVSTDTALEAVHFLPTMPAQAIASRALLTALSDIAAMGAAPFGCLVALSSHQFSKAWITAFAEGMRDILATHQLILLGGNLTRSQHISVTTTVFGHCQTKPLLRSGAQVGDSIFVTGTLGTGALGLAAWQGKLTQPPAVRTRLKQQFIKPPIPFYFAQAIAPCAHAAIDISDGIYSDLHHLATQSDKTCVVDPAQLPLDPIAAACGIRYDISDDYQLCFTAKASAQTRIMQHAEKWQVTCTMIGRVVAADTHRLVNTSGEQITPLGYQHSA